MRPTSLIAWCSSLLRLIWPPILFTWMKLRGRTYLNFFSLHFCNVWAEIRCKHTSTYWLILFLEFSYFLFGSSNILNFVRFSLYTVLPIITWSMRDMLPLDRLKSCVQYAWTQIWLVNNFLGSSNLFNYVTWPTNDLILNYVSVANNNSITTIVVDDIQLLDF